MRNYSERPVLLSIVSILWDVFGGLIALLGFVVILAGAAASSALGAIDGGAGGAAFALAFMVGIVLVAIGGFGVAVGIGLWRMRTWAWWVAVVLTGLVLLLELVSILAVPLLLLSVGTLLFLLLHIGSLVYLLMDEAREACGVSRPRPARPVYRVQPSCPNPECRKGIRLTWRFCPDCRTPLNPGWSQRTAAARR
jgi:hypothetical protein